MKVEVANNVWRGRKCKLCGGDLRRLYYMDYITSGLKKNPPGYKKKTGHIALKAFVCAKCFDITNE